MFGKKAFFLAGITLWGSACAYSQTVISVQDGGWNDPSTWSGGSIPHDNDIVILDHIIYIDPGEVSCAAITVHGRLTLDSGATFNIVGDSDSAQPDLLVTGILVSEDGSSLNGTTALNARFESGSTYVHKQGPLGFVPMAAWSPASTFQISGFTTSGYINIAHSDGWKQAFGNVVYDCPLQIIFVVDLNGYLRNIAGDFIIRNTNGKTLRLSTSQNSDFLVRGNFIVEGNSEVWLGTTSANCQLTVDGDFRYLSSSTGPSYLTTRGNTVLSVAGDFIVNSAGPVRTASSAADSVGSRQVTIQVAGNFSVFNGSIIAAPLGRGLATVKFKGNGVQQVTTSLTGTSFSGNIAFVIESQSSVDLGQSVLSSDAGSLTVGGRLIVGSTHPQGAIQLIRQGNIHIAGTRTFLNGSSIEYNATTQQWIGEGHPINSDLIANNGNTLTLLRDVHVGGRMECQRGGIDTGPSILSIDGDVLISTIAGLITGTLALTGTTNQSMSANGHHIDFLRIAKSPGTSVSVTSPLFINGTILIASTDTDLNSNGYLNLISISDGPNGTASIGPLPAGSSIEGDVIVNRYMSGEGRIYRYISSPISNATVASLMDDVPVTGTFEDPTVGPGIASNSPSLFYYDQSIGDLVKGWTAFPRVGTSSSNALVPGLGYAMFVRNGAGPTILDFTGRINQGEMSLNLSFTGDGRPGNGWNLVGNPYPSTIDWEAGGATGWSKSDLSPVISIRDNGSGGIFHYWDGDDSYDDIPNGHIALGQSFWVRAVGQNPQLIIREGVKTIEAANFYREAPSTIASFAVSISRNGLTDRAFYKIRKAKGANSDAWNAPKLLNDSLNIFIGSTYQPFAIRCLSNNPCDSIVALGIWVRHSGEYEFTIDARAGLLNFDYVLVDLVDNKEFDLRLSHPIKLHLKNLLKPEDGRYFIRLRERRIIDTLQIFHPQVVCGRDDILIKIRESQPGVMYEIVGERDSLKGQSVLSTGGDLALTLSGAHLASGDNHFRIRAFTACQSVYLSTLVTIHVGESPSMQAWVQHDCQSAQATFSVYSDTPGTIFYWFKANSLSDTLTRSSHWTGSDDRNSRYYVMGKLSHGCFTSLYPVHRLPDKLMQADITIGSNGELLSGYDNGNSWFLNGTELPEHGSQIWPFSEGWYTLRVRVNQCVMMDSVYYERHQLQAPEFSISPNPVRNHAIINAVGSQELPASVQVLSQSGSHVADFPVEHFTGKSRQARINLTGLAGGVYLIVFHSLSGHRAIRFIKDD